MSNETELQTLPLEQQVEQTFQQGDKVHYSPSHGDKENGIVKFPHPDRNGYFVVYKCNNDWDNFMNYTGCLTNSEDLNEGWV